LFCSHRKRQNVFLRWAGLQSRCPPPRSWLCVFLYYDTKNAAKVAEFSRSIPPIIIVSIAFFYGFSYLIDRNFSFVMSMLIALLLMFSVYGLYLFLATRIGL